VMRRTKTRKGNREKEEIDTNRPESDSSLRTPNRAKGPLA